MLSGGGSGATATASITNAYTGTVTDPFPPNLDFIGNKQHTGVCFVCHGGQPQTLTSTGAYPNQGRVGGFRMLPLNVRNLLFTSDLGAEITSRVSQELQPSAYNQAVLLTVNQTPDRDGTGAVREPYIAAVIKGWYAGFPGDQTTSSQTQNEDFIPPGWLEPQDGGTARPGSEHLYLTVISPSCRSCHFNPDLSHDFETAANFASDPLAS